MGYEIPDIIAKINKDRGGIKIATLDQARSLILKRFFSGSFYVDDLTGGGYAYKRIQMLFGAKSSGKNAQLQQMIAYNQRLCRKCLVESHQNKIRPDYWESSDRWTTLLRDVMGYQRCTCEEKFEPKKYIIFDFERSLSIEAAKFNSIRNISYTGDSGVVIVDELDYNDSVVRQETLSLKEKITDKEKKELETLEAWLLTLKIETQIVEQAPVTDYLRDCGVIIPELLVTDPPDTEEGIAYCQELIKGNAVDAIIWDSLQAAVPKYITDRDADKATMGVEAKQNGLLMRLVSSAFSAEDITNELEAYKPALFITSQVRAKLGGFVSGPDTYSGGNAVQHHISLALEVKRQNFLDQYGKEASFGKDFYGQRVRVRPDKNKLSAMGASQEYDYYFRACDEHGVGEIDHIPEIIDLGVKYGVVTKNGSFYKFKGQNIQGIQNLSKELKNNPDAVKEIYRGIANKR